MEKALRILDDAVKALESEVRIWTKQGDLDIVEKCKKEINECNEAIEKLRGGECSNENSKLNMLYVSKQHERTLGINSCAALIKSMPTEQAIQIMKSDITGQPQTTVIDGELVVAYVR